MSTASDARSADGVGFEGGAQCPEKRANSSSAGESAAGGMTARGHQFTLAKLRDMKVAVH